MGAKARQAKGKARLSAYEQLLAEANDAKSQRARARDRDPARAAPGRPGHRGRTELRKGYGDRLLIEDLTFSLPRAGIVGIIGPNGAGKTTLFRMLVGQEAPDAGSIEIGDTVQLSYVDQSRDDLGGRQDGVPGDHPGRRDHQGRRAGAPGPGVRVVVQLPRDRPAEAGRRSCPVASATASTWPSCSSRAATSLLLDEPTNDLDVDTLRALEAGLESFPGCVVVISHDRWFLDRIATHILAFEGDSQVRFFEGNVSDYEAFRHKELGTAADQPHRIRYKRLVA